MIFVLTMLFTFVYDRKNENHGHYSLFITHYSLLGIQTPVKLLGLIERFRKILGAR